MRPEPDPSSEPLDPAILFTLVRDGDDLVSSPRLRRAITVLDALLAANDDPPSRSNGRGCRRPRVLRTRPVSRMRHPGHRDS